MRRSGKKKPGSAETKSANICGIKVAANSFDYNFVTNEQSSYEYGTNLLSFMGRTRLRGNRRKRSLRSCSVRTNLAESPWAVMKARPKWDYPYGWAPIHLLALGRPSVAMDTIADSDRITLKFLTMILENFPNATTPYEKKYNVVLDPQRLISA